MNAVRGFQRRCEDLNALFGRGQRESRLLGPFYSGYLEIFHDISVLRAATQPNRNVKYLKRRRQQLVGLKQPGLQSFPTPTIQTASQFSSETAQVT